MNVRIEKSTARGRIVAPPSKSYAHRLLVCAALANGKSTIKNVSLSDDIRATIDCLRALGARIDCIDTLSPQTVRIVGVNGKVRVKDDLYCRESGSTLRFLLPLSLLALNNTPEKEKVVLHGTQRLIERGVSVYEQAFPNAIFHKERSLSESALHIRGEINGGDYLVRGDVSSQFITGLLFALPLLSNGGNVTILPPFESASYVDVTLHALNDFGIDVRRLDDGRFFVKGRQTYRPKDATVEGDWSNAAFLYALSFLGGSIDVCGVNEHSAQGDKVCVDAFRSLSKGKCTANLSNCPDLAPVLFAFAAANHGALFTGTRRLKIKESDRAAAMREELSKFGVEAILTDDTAEIIAPKTLHAPTQPLSSHNDHRIAMALSLLCSLTGGEITDAEAVKKSYPSFYDDLSSLGIVLEKL